MTIMPVNISEILPQTIETSKNGNDGLFCSLLISLVETTENKGSDANIKFPTETDDEEKRQIPEKDLQSEQAPCCEAAVLELLGALINRSNVQQPVEIDPQKQQTSFSESKNELNITDDIDNSKKFAGVPEGFGLLEDNSDKGDLKVLTKAQNTEDSSVQPEIKMPDLHIEPTANAKAYIKTDEKPDGSHANTNTMPAAGKSNQLSRLARFAPTEGKNPEGQTAEAVQEETVKAKQALTFNTEQKAPVEGLPKSEKSPKMQESQDNGSNSASEFTASQGVQPKAEIKTQYKADGAEPKRQEQSFKADNFENIVQKVAANVQGEIKQFEVELKPEHLGRLKIKLMMEDDGIKAFIKAADSQVKEMLQSECANLCGMLKEKGVNITNMHIAYEPVFADADPGRNAQHDRYGQKGTKRHMQSQERFSAAQDMPYIMRETSSVEFCA